MIRVGDWKYIVTMKNPHIPGELIGIMLLKASLQYP